MATRYRNFIYDSARWEGFVFRPDDIVISTPPKCGTTWMQMLCALLIFRTPQLSAPLAQLSPWIDMQTRPLADVLHDLDAQTHRRFIKSHTPFDGIPFDRRVTYICVGRDPRDAGLSWDNHMANMDMGAAINTRITAVGADDLAELGDPASAALPPSEDPVERFWAWIESDRLELVGLAALVHHVGSFWDRKDEPNVHLFHYADLRADLGGQMARLAEVLEVDPPTDELVAAATFEAMKERADELIPNSDTPFWHDNRKFFDQARSGGWSSVIDAAGEERYRKALAALGRPELTDWLHHGGPQK